MLDGDGELFAYLPCLLDGQVFFDSRTWALSISVSSMGPSQVASWHKCPVNICLLFECLPFPGKLETQE